MGNRQDRRPQKNRIHYVSDAVQILARWTGLEPATTGVTGRYSNQLSYHRAEYLTNQISKKMVGDDGVEPPTFCL